MKSTDIVLNVTNEPTANNTRTSTINFESGEKVTICFNEAGEPRQICFIDNEGVFLDVEPYSNYYKDYLELAENHLFLEEYEEGAQNRFRNNDNTSFEEWLENRNEN
jgi:hypothetical protein